MGRSAGAVAIHRPEEFDRGEHRIVGRVRPEVERREKARAEPAQHRVSLGRRDEDVLIRHIGHGPDDGKHAVELLHADLAFDHGDAILTGLLRAAERGDGAAEQDQCPGDIAPRGLETPLVAVPRPAEQGAHVFLEHGERRVGQPGFQAGGLNREDRRAPCRFEIGDVLDGHDRPLVDQPGETGGVDTSGARGVDSQPARIFETIQQRDDVGGGGRLRIIPQPGKAGAAQLGIDREQSRERVALRIGQSGRERIEGLLSRACTGSQPDSLQHGGRRKQNAVRPQMGEHRLDDGFTAIRGPCRFRADPKTGSPVSETEAAETQQPLKFEHVLATGFRPAGVFAEQRRIDADLLRHKDEHWHGRRLQRVQHAAWMPKSAKLNGEAQPIARATPGPYEGQIVDIEHADGSLVCRV